MINDQEIAKHVRDVLLKCGADINESVLYVQENCSEEEFKVYRDAMSEIMSAILFAGLNPVLQQHPDLKPEGLD